MIKKILSGCGKAIFKCSGRTRCLIALGISSLVMFAVLAFSINTVSVSADGKQVVTLKTMLSDTESILKLADVQYSDEDLVTTDESLGKVEISVTYAFPVYITLGSNTKTVTTTGATVGELLDMANIMVSENDIVNYDLNTFISKTSYIDVVDIDYITETYNQRIYYKEHTKYSKDLPKGQRVVVGGEEGKKQVTCRKTIVNGVVTDEKIVNEVVLSEPVDKIITIGTKKVSDPIKESVSTGAKPEKNQNTAVTDSSKVKSVSVLKPSSPIKLDSKGNPVSYKKHLTVQATAYLAKGTCATGVPSKPGYIAVNPNYIPYGTKMYIKSSDGKYVYGYAIAADTGGFIRTKPNNVDLAFPTNDACVYFGRRNVEIYILE